MPLEDVIIVVMLMGVSFIMGMQYEAMNSFRKRVEEWKEKG